MGAFVSRAHQAGSCLLVVTRSSNPEGRAVQSALDGNGRRVDERLLGEIGKLNLMLAPGQVGPVGAVVRPASSLSSTWPARRRCSWPPASARKGLPPRTWPGSSRPAPPG